MQRPRPPTTICSALTLARTKMNSLNVAAVVAAEVDVVAVAIALVLLVTVPTVVPLKAAARAENWW